MPQAVCSASALVFQISPNHPLHHPEFKVDETAIVTGVVTLVYAAYKYWQRS